MHGHNKAGKSCLVCIFGQSLPSRCSFSTRGSSSAHPTTPPTSQNLPPPLLGWLLWELSLPQKTPAFTSPMGSNTAPGGRPISLGRLLSQQEQKTLPSFGTAPQATLTQGGRFRRAIESTRTAKPQLASVPPHTLLLPPLYQQHCRSKHICKKTKITDQLSELSAEPAWPYRGTDSTAGSSWLLPHACQLYDLCFLDNCIATLTLSTSIPPCTGASST